MYVYIYIYIYMYTYTYIYIYIYIRQTLYEEFTRLAETRLAQNTSNHTKVIKLTLK